MKETIIITGSSSFIGYAASARLAKQYHIVGLDPRGAGYSHPTIDHFQTDFTSHDSVQKSLKTVKNRFGEYLASVIHFSSFFHFSDAAKPEYEEMTVRGTRRLLRELQHFNVGQFVFLSTMLVHAPCEPGQAINEDWPLFPRSHYSLSKYKAEELIHTLRGDFPYVVARIAGIYDRQCRSIPLSRQIQRIYERKWTRKFFPGHLSHGLAYLHLDDLLDAIELLLLHRSELPPELALLLSEPETYCYDELQHKLSRLIHGERLNTHQVPKALAKAVAWTSKALPFLPKMGIEPWMVDVADDHYAVDISRARQLIGWEPRRSLRLMLPEIIADFKTDLRGWYRRNGLEVPSWIKNRSGLRDRRSGISMPKPGTGEQRKENRDRRTGTGNNPPDEKAGA